MTLSQKVTMINTSFSDNLPVKFCSKHKVHLPLTIFSVALSALSPPFAVAGRSLVLAAIWEEPVFQNTFLHVPLWTCVKCFCTRILGHAFYVSFRVAELKRICHHPQYCQCLLIKASFTIIYNHNRGRRKVAIHIWVDPACDFLCFASARRL